MIMEECVIHVHIIYLHCITFQEFKKWNPCPTVTIVKRIDYSIPIDDGYIDKVLCMLIWSISP